MAVPVLFLQKEDLATLNVEFISTPVLGGSMDTGFAPWLLTLLLRKKPHLLHNAGG